MRDGYVRPVVLACDHVATFNPEPRLGDLVWCSFCLDYRLVARFRGYEPKRRGTTTVT